MFTKENLGWIEHNKPYPHHRKKDENGNPLMKDNFVLQHLKEYRGDDHTVWTEEKVQSEEMKKEIMKCLAVTDPKHKGYKSIQELFQLTENPPAPVESGDVRAGFGTKADTLFETKDWRCVLSPTPYMAQLHLILWSKNPEDQALFHLKRGENLDKRIDEGLIAATEFIHTKTEIDVKTVKFRAGVHMPPSIPRVHVHVLIGQITEMGMNEDNAKRWYPVA